MRSMFDLMGGNEAQDEIVVDLFAGGGGASEGIRMALGRNPDAAANHNPLAVAMHTANHPDTVHYTEDVWALAPSAVTMGRPVGLLWASPDCTHFSKAKGGAPHRDERIRSLARVLTDKWLPQARPRVLIMENVEEFKSWCDLIPLLDKKGNPVFDKKTGKRVMVPDKTKIDADGFGNLFKAWVRKIRRNGYSIQWKELRACDYGSPTIRKRLFLIARCDGQPITWPEPTHGDPKSEAVQTGKLLPWRTAAECIDWSHPCPSIFDTAKEIKAKYGLTAKRPLAEKTLKRIAVGIQRYILEAEKPFVVNLTHGVRLEDVDEPFKTVTGAHRGEKGVVTPCLVKSNHGYKYFRGNAVDEPLRTVTACEPGFCLVTPFLTEHANGSSQRNFDVQEPLRTICAQIKGGHFALVSPALVKNNEGNAPTDPTSPLHTITTGGRHIACAAFLAKNYTGVVGAPLEQPAPTVTTVDHNSLVTASMALFCGQSVAQDVEEPARTVTGTERHGLVTCHIDRQFGMSRGNGVLAPLGTTTADGGGKSALVTSNLTKFYGTSVGSKVDLPMHTLTAGGENGDGRKMGLVASNLVKMRGTNTAAPTDAPIHTISAGGLHHAEVRAFLMRYYSEGGQHGDPGDPMHTLTTKGRIGLVTVEGEEYVIADIGMRMLQPRELYLAQGFPESYIIDKVLIDGKWKPLSKTAQVKFCGNSVCPDMACALVSSNVVLKVAAPVAA